MAYSQAWLDKSDVRRCLLVEATVLTGAGVLTTLYFSTSGYNTLSSDAHYSPIVAKDLELSENISTEDGSISVTYGDIELNNFNGELDHLLDDAQYVWTNGSIKVYYGDPTWVCNSLIEVHADFELVFDGVILDIDSRARNSLNIKVADKLERLNTPVTETKLGIYGTWGGTNQTNIDTIVPIVFGEVFNVSPLLVDPAKLEYRVCNELIEQIIEVRDNGVPVAFASKTNSGTFKLGKPLVGVCTCSVQGVKKHTIFNTETSSIAVNNTYNNNIASIIGLIVTQYGSSVNRLTSQDIDIANFESFYISNQQVIGLQLSDRENTLAVCNRIASSIGAQLFFTRQGKLQLIRRGVATNDATVDISSTDIISGSLYISNKTKVRAATKLGYAKNWTVQEGLVTSIPEAHKYSYSEEWLTVTATDTDTKNKYKLFTDPVQVDTLLIRKTDAESEADRLTQYNKVPRVTLSFTGTSKLLSLKIGQAVLITHPRFNLSVGVMAQVISLSPRWLEGLVDVSIEVLDSSGGILLDGEQIYLDNKKVSLM